MRALIAYLSYSGNTGEVAEITEYLLKEAEIEVSVHEIGIDPPVHASQYDLIFIGTFTWDYGKTPDEVKDFVLDVGYKPNNVAVFGTGDTQFGGDDMFCGAVNRLVKFYHSKWDGLKIEQSPRGYQEQYITEWLEGVFADVRSYA